MNTLTYWAPWPSQNVITQCLGENSILETRKEISKLDEKKDFNRDNQLSCMNRILESRTRENYAEQTDGKPDKMIKIFIMFCLFLVSIFN